METRKALIESALKLFGENGFGATSVDEIAARAGVSRSTFFRYFGSKEAVIFAQPDEASARFLEVLVSRPKGEGPVEAFERSLIDMSTEGADEERRNSSRLLEETFQQDPALATRRIMQTERLAEMVADAFANRGGRSETTYQDRVAAAMCTAATAQIGKEWRKESDESAVDLICRAFATLREVVAGD
jgi:AcrR family transcriptional regulator